MASRVSFRRWLLRDIRRAYLLLALAAFAVGPLVYFTDWSHREPAVKVKSQSKADSEEKRYAGSVLIPTGGDQCWQIMLDNRNGRMWEKGYVKCDEAQHEIAGNSPPEKTRLREVGKAFRNAGD